EDGIRGFHVTGVQTCALPISTAGGSATPATPAAASAPSSSFAPKESGAPAPPRRRRPPSRPGGHLERAPVVRPEREVGPSDETAARPHRDRTRLPVIVPWRHRAIPVHVHPAGHRPPALRHTGHLIEPSCARPGFRVHEQPASALFHHHDPGDPRRDG